MTTLQLKKEINKVLDQVPENRLGAVLDFLKQVQSDQETDEILAANFKKILAEDSELLQKLAE
jgi:hypothetical protein